MTHFVWFCVVKLSILTTATPSPTCLSDDSDTGSVGSREDVSGGASRDDLVVIDASDVEAARRGNWLDT